MRRMVEMGRASLNALPSASCRHEQSDSVQDAPSGNSAANVDRNSKYA
jgi:hypothetical protein